MSIIPKINVGLSGKKRSKLNLDFDNSTTLNIGVVQPTMCREMVPNETFKVKVSSLVRLAPMPVPTFARMSLRHYHTFVPYAELWQPFTAMLSGQSYTNNTGGTFIPTKAPDFNFDFLFKFILTFSDITVLDENFNPIVITNGTEDETIVNGGQTETRWSLFRNSVKTTLPSSYGSTQRCFNENLINDFRSKTGTTGSYGDLDAFGPGVFRQGGMILKANSTWLYSFPNFETLTSENLVWKADAGVITLDGADFVFETGYSTSNTYFACKLKTPLKNLRSIFIGLGYPFNPFIGDDISFNAFKLLAFYKSWFELFSPNRELTFNETSCYKLIKQCSNSSAPTISNISGFGDFLLDLMCNCYYYLPMDYFGMSVTAPYSQFGNGTITMQTGDASYSLTNGTFSNYGDVKLDSNTSLTASHQAVTMNDSTNPLVIRLANRLLTFAGKNTVIGRQIQDYLRVHYGIAGSEHHADDSSVYKLGSSRVQINVSDIMSTADTATAKVGDYAGKGIGYGDSDITEYTAKEFGCWITLSVIVPESGYYQGYLLENRMKSRFEYFTPEFDALGYQVLERGELMTDYPVASTSFLPNNEKIGYDKAFGFVPRYSHLKVGKNILNGDLSLNGSKSSMLPYTFDRSFPSYRKVQTGEKNGASTYTVSEPTYRPNVIYDGFRRVDPSDKFGDYNRIFNYTSVDVDHFILHNLFKVTAIAPYKPLADSFDSVVEDDKVTQVTKA